MSIKKIEDIKKSALVYITAFDERTLGLSKICFSRLGYENIVVDNSKLPFYEKMDLFRRFAIENKDKFDIFIRSDADRLVFSGVDDLVFQTYNDKIVTCSEGTFFDGLMQKKRGGTPVLYKKSAVDLWENIKVPNSRKPESDFISSYTNGRTMPTWKCYDILTNLHDFEQYPSKVCNVILNRYYRNHIHLYDRSNPEIKKPWEVVDKFLSSGQSISGFEYIDFSFLDSDSSPIVESQYTELIEKYEKFYNSVV